MRFLIYAPLYILRIDTKRLDNIVQLYDSLWILCAQDNQYNYKHSFC